MKKRKRYLALAAVLGASTLFAGCADGGGEKDVLTVGVRDDIMNFGFQNPDTGRYYGMEIDLATEMADRLGYKDIEFVTVDPDNRKEILLNGEADCLVACYSIAETRLENFDFSPAYYTDVTNVMVEKSTLIESLDEMKNMVIGIMDGSNVGPLLAQKLYDMGMITDVVVSNTDDGTQYEGMYVKKFPSYAELSEGLEEGIVDAACMDGSIARTFMNDDRKLLDVNVSEQNYGVATQKDSELSEPVAETIQEMLDDGTVETLINKWN